MDFEPIAAWIRDALGATSVRRGAHIQTLWSGYGELYRVRLEGAAYRSAIVKQVEPPTKARHPAGWSTDRGHERKLRSYQVEHAWYRDWAERCPPGCRVPKALATASSEHTWHFLLEDLDASGFEARSSGLTPVETDLCLAWLARFHATFLHTRPKGLWRQGTYWHLSTRPDELDAMRNRPLKKAAKRIDQQLREARFKTLVHGDAKPANFCFAPDRRAVAAVDFQYVGGGCGMKDVAYLLSNESSASSVGRSLDAYFRHLRRALGPDVDADALEAEWRSLYPVAFADFHRFLDGWAPGWGIHHYGQRLTADVLKAI